MKPKRCKACGAEFIPARALQRACKLECAVALGRQAVQRKRRLEVRKGRVALRSRRDWVKLAQGAFNAYIRARDAGKPCISCGTRSNAKRNAGHYRSVGGGVGAAPQLRFDERQVHLQCERCNRFLSGNQLQYRKGLIERIGLAEVESIEADNRIHKHTVDELKAIIALYKGKVAGLKEKGSNAKR